MTDFKDRERGFEAKFANDEEFRFRVEAKRDRLVGTWAGGKLGLSGAELEEYARSVIKADLEEPGDDDVFRKLRKDLNGANTKVSDEEIRQKMNECFDRAREELIRGA